jgi:hypothetical protein
MNESFRKQHAKGEASLQEKRDQEAADKLRIAKHFSTPEGKEVLVLLMRRFGVLGRRIRSASDSDLIVGQRDGEAAAPLFILQCLKEAGETTITLEL